MKVENKITLNIYGKSKCSYYFLMLDQSIELNNIINHIFILSNLSRNIIIKLKNISYFISLHIKALYIKIKIILKK